VVVQIVAYGREVDNGRHIYGLQQRRISYPRYLQQLRRVQGTGCDDSFFLNLDGLPRGVGGAGEFYSDDLHNSILVLGENPCGLLVGNEMEVLALRCCVVVGFVGRGAGYVCGIQIVRAEVATECVSCGLVVDGDSEGFRCFHKVFFEFG
jgi:hypothetical protein